MKRWEKESKDFLEKLGGPVENPLIKKTGTAPAQEDGKSGLDEISLREQLQQKQVAGRGRPSLSGSASSRKPALKTYNFRVSEEKLEQLKRIALVETKLMQEVIGEAVDDYIEKHRDSLRR